MLPEPLPFSDQLAAHGEDPATLFRLDFHSDVPLYLQVAAQAEQAIAVGRLRPGDSLPSVRALAEALEVSPDVVIQAYRELIRTGMAVAQRASWPFGGGLAVPIRSPALALIDRTVDRALHLGLSAAEIRAQVERRLDRAERQDRRPQG